MAATRRLRRRPQQKPLAGWDLMERALRRLRLLDEVQARRALLAFEQACGPRLREHTRPERFSRGTLYIRVASSSWATQLSFVQADLLARIHQLPGGEGVRELRFSVGPLDEVPAWSAAPPAREAPAPTPAPVDHRVAAALTQVPDDELRDALGALYVSACRAGRQSPITRSARR
jgi:hypothetical protein